VRQTLVTTGELYRGLGNAIAQSFDSFLGALHPDEVAAQGITRSTLEGIAEGNAGFYDSLANSSRRVSDEVRTTVDRRVRPVQEPIDYERLAKLVAEELRTTGATG
jgi:hypothetical protein